MQGVVWLGQSAGRQKTQWAIMDSVMWPIDERRVVFMPPQPARIRSHTQTRARPSVLLRGAYLHTWFHDVNFALHCWPSAARWLVICRLSGLSSSPLILHPPPYNSLQIRLSHNELCHGRIEREGETCTTGKYHLSAHRQSCFYPIGSDDCIVGRWRHRQRLLLVCTKIDRFVYAGIKGMHFSMLQE
jgi:hypothetical protein